MTTDQERPAAGQRVVLVSLPDGFLDHLPQADREAISAIIGAPVSLVDYDEDGRAELEFTDAARPGHHGTIWVDAKHIRTCR